MKSIILSLSFLLSSILVMAQKTTVTIQVNNIQVGKGSVVINIYDKEASFFKTAFVSKTQTADNASLKFTFEIPNGTYAISIYQDIDNNGKLNQGWFEIPLEPVGFGNNFKPKFSAPTFHNCAVIISKSNNQFTISLN
ncbi:MAG: DUF2141 domain-containing protein [Bacteroidota bacterium]|nr:DUF2141 domain-containing protein [Bacteroidota bacterium]